MKKRIPLPTYEQVTGLPEFYRQAIPDSYRDIMGHMNVRWYMALFDETAWRFFHWFGMTEDYCRTHHAGAFALEHHLFYINEVNIGDEVAVHVRVLDFTPKRVHMMFFMVNQTSRQLACTLEGVESHMDLQTRKTSPHPPHISAKVQELLAGHRVLEWDAPVCGVIRA